MPEKAIATPGKRRAIWGLCALMAMSAVRTASADLPPEAMLPAITLAELLAPPLANASSAEVQVFRLLDQPRVAIFDYPDLPSQGDACVRIVLFVERANAPKQRLLSIRETAAWLDQAHEWPATLTAGNNFRAGQLARFFNTARHQGEALSPAEHALRQRLLDYRILTENAQGLVASAPEMVVLTLARISASDACPRCSVTAELRQAALVHELAHARYATDARYRTQTQRFWHKRLAAAERQRIMRFLAERGYDTGLPELLIDETQAFVGHTPNEAIFSARHLGVDRAVLQRWRQQFQEELARP